MQVVYLFPEKNFPFWAGFGNRGTDVISYESVGLDRNRVYIINEAGMVKNPNDVLSSTSLIAK